jgi:hypothetical protein
VVWQERRVLVIVTLDVDLGDIRAHLPVEYPGDRRPQGDQAGQAAILAAISRIIPLLSTEAVTQRLWVVEGHAVPIRGET